MANVYYNTSTSTRHIKMENVHFLFILFSGGPSLGDDSPTVNVKVYEYEW